MTPVRLLTLNVDGLRVPSDDTNWTLGRSNLDDQNDGKVLDDNISSNSASTSTSSVTSWTILWKLVAELGSDLLVLTETHVLEGYMKQRILAGFRRRDWDCVFADSVPSKFGGRARMGVLIAWKRSVFSPASAPIVHMTGRVLEQQLQTIGGATISVLGCYGPDHQHSDEVEVFWSVLRDNLTDSTVISGDLNSHLEGGYTRSDWHLKQLVDIDCGLVTDLGISDDRPAEMTYSSGTFATRIDYILVANEMAHLWSNVKVIPCGKKHRAVAASWNSNVQTREHERPRGVRGVSKLVPKYGLPPTRLQLSFKNRVEERWRQTKFDTNPSVAVLQGQNVLKSCAEEVLHSSQQLKCKSLEGSRWQWSNWKARHSFLKTLQKLPVCVLRTKLTPYVRDNWHWIRSRVSGKRQCVSLDRVEDTLEVLLQWCCRQENFWAKVYDGRRDQKRVNEQQWQQQLTRQVEQRGLAGAFRCLRRERRQSWKPVDALHPEEDESLPVVDDPAAVCEVADRFGAKHFARSSVSEDNIQRWMDAAPVSASDLSSSWEDMWSWDRFRLVLKNMGRGKAVGADGFSIELLQASPEEIQQWFCGQLATMAGSHNWPEIWDLAVITAIPKTPKPKPLMGERRPISCQCHGLKLMMLMMKDHLEEVAEATLCKEQAGFRRRRGCLEHAVTLSVLLETARRQGHPVYSLFVDFKGAYDSVPFQQLWQVLRARGVLEPVVQLVEKVYGRARSCYITQHGCSSGFNVGKGVRQGCPLSPILFNMFLDCLLRVCVNTCPGVKVDGHTQLSLLAYADDVVMLAESPADLQRTLDLLSMWCLDTGMALNIDEKGVKTA